MLERVLSRSNLILAWKRVKANKGVAGTDGIRIAEFPEYVRSNWKEMKGQLLNGTYKPKPVLRVEIAKRGGGKRGLGIPCIQDRLIQQAILQMLQPIFDPTFSQHSYGFRPKRSAHGAVRRVRELIKEGYNWIIDIDIAKFFDRVNHDILMNRLAKRVKDKRILKLIGRYLRSGVEVNGVIFAMKEGVPQGSPLSPLLANIVLDELDKELERRGLKFVRYADDGVILVKSKRAAERVMKSIAGFLEVKLKLEVNKEKSKIVTASELEYLGFIFKGKRIIWSEESLTDFKYKIRRLTSRSWEVGAFQWKSGC